MIFVIPCAISFQSILYKTQTANINIITNGFNRVYWPIFGDLRDTLNQIYSKYLIK